MDKRSDFFTSPLKGFLFVHNDNNEYIGFENIYGDVIIVHYENSMSDASYYAAEGIGLDSVWNDRATLEYKSPKEAFSVFKL